MQPTTKNKIRIILTALTTFLMFGMGQMLSGRIKRGLVIYIIAELIIIAGIFLCIQPIPPFNIILPLAIALSVLLAVFIDSIICAKNADDSHKLKAPFVVIVVALLVLDSSFIQPMIKGLIRENVVQAFRIPSLSMNPSLLIGDHILVDKQAYSHGKPGREDIVVFKSPVEPSRTFIRRVIGIGGDIVEIRDNKVFINNNKLSENYIIDNNEKPSGTEMGSSNNVGPVTVPEGYVFVLGDNRSQSNDSRNWGSLDINNIFGRAATIYWSWDRTDGKVRWGRIGQVIH